MESLMGIYMTPSPRLIDDSILKAQFQQKQMQEKEAKLLQMFDNQQQRVLEKANGVLNKYSANNNNQYTRLNGNSTSPAPLPPGKVRQMFEERRKGGGNMNGSSAPSNSNGHTPNRNGGLLGIDKSYPLEPIITPPTTKSRSSSSKSNPAVLAAPSPGPKRNAIPPLIKPSNLGSSNKPPREVSGGARAPSPPKAAPSRARVTPTPTQPKYNSSGRVSVEQRSTPDPYSPVSSPSPVGDEGPYQPPVVVPTTTKYLDYASELDKREATLANKLKGLDLGGPSSASQRAKPASPKNVVQKPSPATGGLKSTTGKPNASAGSSRSAITPFKKSVGGTKKLTSAVVKVKKSSEGPPPGHDECKMCGRYFASDRIGKHESICKKVATKKRKVFDPTKMRMQGTEAEPYIRIVSAKGAKAPVAKQAQGKKADWRKKHEEFIRTIRAAKEYQTHIARGGDPADLPPPPPSDNSDYVQCPYCNRKFSEGAAERHIPKCKNIKSNKK